MRADDLQAKAGLLRAGVVDRIEEGWHAALHFVAGMNLVAGQRPDSLGPLVDIGFYDRPAILQHARRTGWRRPAEKADQVQQVRAEYAQVECAAAGSSLPRARISNTRPIWPVCINCVMTGNTG